MDAEEALSVGVVDEIIEWSGFHIINWLLKKLKKFIQIKMSL